MLKSSSRTGNETKELHDEYGRRRVHGPYHCYHHELSSSVGKPKKKAYRLISVLESCLAINGARYGRICGNVPIAL